MPIDIQLSAWKKRRARDCGLVLLLLAVLLLSACDGSPDVAEGDLLIAGGRVVDTASGSIGDRKDVLVRAGRIHAILEPGTLHPSATTRFLDAEGLFLLPGLIDVHAHIGDGGLAEHSDEDRLMALQQFARYGVTSIFVPGGGGGNDEQLNQWKQRCLMTRYACPNIFGSGDIITAYGSHPITTIWGLPPDADPDLIHERGATALRESDPVKPLIARKIESGVDALKIVVEDGPGGFAPKPKLSRQKIGEICEAAQQSGLRVFAHVSLAAHVDDVVDAGCNGIMHAPDDMLSTTTLQKMADEEIFYVATLSLFDGMIDQAENRRDQDPYALEGVSARALASLDNEQYWATTSEIPELIAEWKSALARNLKMASDMGVPIALGTDTNNPQVFPGYSVHEELVLMTESGLTEREALKSATTTAAAFLDRSGSLGKIAEGYRADIVALRRNPFDNIENSRSIEFVLVGGKFVDEVVSIK